MLRQLPSALLIVICPLTMRMLVPFAVTTMLLFTPLEGKGTLVGQVVTAEPARLVDTELAPLVIVTCPFWTVTLWSPLETRMSPF